QLVTGPGRVLRIGYRRHAQKRYAHLRETCPPVLLTVAETPEQLQPAQGFQRQTDRLVFWPALQAATGQIGKGTQQQTRTPLHRRHLQRPVGAADLTAEQRGRARARWLEMTTAQRSRQDHAAQ